jgi:hypothetical protein
MLCTPASEPRVRGAQNGLVLAQSAARKPAPMLAMRGAAGRTRLRPTAFGNALGSSIVDSQSEVNWSNAPDESAAETARLGRYEKSAQDDEAWAQHVAATRALPGVGNDGWSDELRDGFVKTAGPASRDAGGGRGFVNPPMASELPSQLSSHDSQQELDRINEVLRETRGRGPTRGALYAQLAYNSFDGYSAEGQRNLLNAMDGYANALHAPLDEGMPTGQVLPFLHGRAGEARRADLAVRIAADLAYDSESIPQDARFAAQYRQGMDVTMSLLAGGLMRRPQTEAAGSAAPGGAIRGAVTEANFAQPRIRVDEAFSDVGQAKYSALAGREIKTVEDLSLALRNGEIHPSQIPVDFVDLNGTRLILNTRTSTALTRAEVQRSDWYGTNQTGKVADFETGITFDELARAQLSRNSRSAIPGQVGWPELKTGGKR